MEDDSIKWTHLLEVLDRVGKYFCEQARMQLFKDGSNATGTLTNSFTYSYGVEEGRYWVDITMEDYGKYVNDGRKAGKMPPISKIRDWVVVKKIQPRPYTYTPSVKSLAFLIQRSMKKSKGYAPPRTILENWINKKGIQPRSVTITPSIESLAYLIARKIGRYGTKGTGFFDKVKDDTLRYFERSIDNAIQEDLTYWLEEIMADTLSSMSI